MTANFQISPADIIQQVKLSRQMPSLIEEFLSRQIILQQAELHGIQIATDELQQAADTLRSKYELWTAEATWIWLNHHALSIEDFEELAYVNLLSTKLAQHLFMEQAHDFFMQNQADYIQAILYEVVFPDQDLALELFYALQEQEIQFSDVAERYIDQPELRQSGGYRGALRRSELAPAIAERVFAAQAPELLRPIALNNQSHLVYVEKLVQPSFEPPVSCGILSEFLAQWLKQQVELAKQDVQLEL